MPFNQQIDDLRAALDARLPAYVNQAFQDLTDALVADGLAEKAVRTGMTAPDFALPDTRGDLVRLADLLAQGPVVLSFFRGAWCPYCSLELAAHQASFAEFQALGASLVAVSLQTPARNRETAESCGLGFRVLSDEGGTVTRRYGLAYTVPPELRLIYERMEIDFPALYGDESFTLVVPATYVIAKDGTVVCGLVDPDVSRRLDPEALKRVLEGLRGGRGG